MPTYYFHIKIFGRESQVSLPQWGDLHVGERRSALLTCFIYYVYHHKFI